MVASTSLARRRLRLIQAKKRSTYPRTARRPGYNSGWFRAALIERGIASCIPSTRSRKVALPYDKAMYRQRHRIENASAG